MLADLLEERSPRREELLSLEGPHLLEPEEAQQLGLDPTAFRLVASERNVVVEDFGRVEYEA